MKKFKMVSLLLAITLATSIFSSCYLVNAQTMKSVKGTYKLTNYTYTPQYERKEGYTPTTIDYIADRGYEVYLVVTGESEGYYVHKDNEVEAYSTKVSLTYEYDQEDSSKVSRVQYKTSLSTEWESFGVTKDALNYSLPSFDYTELFTKRLMRSKDVSKSWKKVDDATDLSYVKEQLGAVKEFDFEGYSVRGLYEIFAYNTVDNVNTLPDSAFPFVYFYVYLDSSTNLNATMYYQVKGTETPVKETQKITLVDGWNTVRVGESFTFTKESSNNFYRIIENGADSYRENYWLTSEARDVTEERIQELIAEKQASFAGSENE